MVRVQTDVITQPPSLSVEGVVISSARGTLVSSFDWKRETGGVAWLIGENGTGKSSLLRALAGWQRPKRGRVQWTGTGRRSAHYYTPSMVVPGDMKVGDWLDYVHALVPSPPNRDLVDTLFPTTAVEARRFRQLSTGESKRLMLWALFLPWEGPVILDEPYEHLSRDAKRSLTVMLRELSRSTLVIVATNQDIPLVSGEQLLVLDGTRVEVESYP
jgi:ABC-type transport system involved in cytochrome c biogenesis ATPase subunit